MKIAIVPSNQHLNPYAGLPGVTEERWAVETCNYLKQRLLDYTDVRARIFHVWGTGSTSVDELSRMVGEAMAWEPDYCISVHSDAVGDVRVTGILMLMARESDRVDGRVLGHMIADAVGLPYKSTWVYGNEARKILYLRALREQMREGCLVEVGEHATVPEARWNWTHTRWIGEGIADALADHLRLEGDDMNAQERAMLESIDLKTRQDRVTNVAHSNDTKAVLAELRGHPEQADQMLAAAYDESLKVKHTEGLPLSQAEVDRLHELGVDV